MSHVFGVSSECSSGHDWLACKSVDSDDVETRRNPRVSAQRAPLDRTTSKGSLHDRQGGIGTHKTDTA